MSRLIDVTLSIYPGMPLFPAPWYPKPRIEEIVKYEEGGRRASMVSLCTHTATHIDAPAHFVKGGKNIDEIALEVFIGEALIADVHYKNPKEDVNKADLRRALGDNISEGSRIIIYTGWTEKKWGATDYFSSAPYLGKDAAEWLVEQKIKLVGLDMQTDKPGVKDLVVHKTLLQSGCVIIEYLTNLQTIKKNKVRLIALPLKLKAEAAPARVIVIEE